MESQQLLAFIDSLDLDEEFINKLLAKIMTRSTFTTKHLENALRFLKYKLAVNKEESLSCTNEREYEFIAKLLKDVTSENVNLLCDMIKIVLQLHPNTIVSKSEHLLQQILSGIELLPLPTMVQDESIDDECPKTLIDLKLINSILEAVLSQKKKVSLLFLQVPLENMVFSPHDRILNYFYSNIIPNFNNVVNGFFILNRLWVCLKNTNDNLLTLKSISSLADHYLPVNEDSEKHNIYTIAADSEFWKTVLFGLQSDDTVVRKRAIYLIKRALESLTGSQKDININTSEMVMVWDKKNGKMLKEMWDNFFILIDSLEEVQSNIVLPSLKLFESVKHLGHCWLSCAYNIGLQHDNSSVRLNCLKYRLEIKIENKTEAESLLKALNDINLYENPLDSGELTANISKALEDKYSLMHILEAMPNVKWSPVPLYYVTETLGEVVYPSLLLNVENRKICSIINDILRIPCNSPVIKKAIYAHMSNFIVNSCRGFIWEDYVSIYPNFHVETPLTSFIMTALASHIKKNLYLSDTDKNGFAEAMATSCENINIALLYVSAHEQDGIPFLLGIINDKVEKVVDICNRPFANKALCLLDVTFLINVYSATAGRSEPYMVFLNGAVTTHYKVILQYLSSLLSSTISLDVDGMISLYDTLNAMSLNDISAKDILLELYKTTVLLLKDKDTPMDKRTSATSIMNYLLNSHIINQYHRNKLISLEDFLGLVKTIGKDMNMHGSGKLKTTFYEKSCEIVLLYLKENCNASDVREVFPFVEDVHECGGYGCLKFILRIINKLVSQLIDNERVRFNFSIFLNQMWMQICELKTNKEYVVCVDEYVRLITQDDLLKHPQHNNVVVGHYTTIIDLAVTKRMPLYFLVKHLSSKNCMAYNDMVNVLCNILLYAIVPKKDQRITENLTVELFPKMQGIMMPDTHVFSQHIQILSIIMLSKVTDVNKLNEISDNIMLEIDQILKAKPRYYTNNTTHRKLFRAMQTLLFIFLKNRQVDVKKTATWCMNLLKIPHDVSVKICILWYIALFIYAKDLTIDRELMNYLSQNGVPLVCQFTIVYFVMRHKIPARMHFASESEFVLDFLLSNTMGPVFTVRLTAQYYAMMLFETDTIRKKINIDKYSTLITILSKTLGELVASKDNTFNNLRNDYFIQTFDIVSDLTLMFIFHTMQRQCEPCNENIDSPFALKIFSQIDEVLINEDHDAFFVEWKGSRRWHGFLHYQGLPSSNHLEAQEEANTIQKKYIPWRNMTDMEMDKFRRNLKNVTELIVVASLVNRTPNLGGLARTCEVFGVMSYVIDNLRHVHDKQFQSLSVSADRWVNIEEVHTGRALKEYVLKKKKEGYCIVAAEQTSNSRDLTEFRFPKKSLIMLGHEKEGIPPNLLPLMDFCVEIPQQGVIRSLNVHVTASIFIWEYARQLATRSAPPYLK